MEKLYHADADPLAMRDTVMTRGIHDSFTRFRRVWSVVLGCLVALVPLVAHAQSSSLPVCSREGLFYIYPSPFYEQDQTLYLKEDATRSPGGSALWHSSDGGHSWRILLDITNLSGLNMGPTYPVPIPSDPDPQLYLATLFGVPFGNTDPMLLFSNNGGVTWEARIPCVFDCNNWLYPTNESGVLYGVEHYDPWGHYSSGIWRTTDGARSEWTKVWDGTEAIRLAVSPSYVQDDTLFAGLRAKSPQLGSAVVASTDGGETWEGRGGSYLCENDVAFVQLSSTFAQDHTAFVRQANSLFKSLDAGNTWLPVFPPNPPYCQGGTGTLEAGDFLLSPNFGQDETLYLVATNEVGTYLLASSDGGATWTQQLQQSIHFTLVSVLPIETGAMSVLDRQTRDSNAPDAAQLRMSGQDQEWKTFVPRVDRSAPAPVARPFTLFMRTNGSNMSGFSYYRSDDGGVTWACMELPPPISP